MEIAGAQVSRDALNMQLHARKICFLREQKDDDYVY